MPFPPTPGTFKIDFHGLDLVRSRDCVIFTKDDTFPVKVSEDMLQGGWPGGQAVQWADASTDDFTVTYAFGRGSGFMVWGSDESADLFTAATRTALTYGFSVMFAGSSLLSTSSYEQYTYTSRLGGPLVPLVYDTNDDLYFSLRGLWTKEDELTLSGSGLAPSPSVGRVAQVPQDINQHFLGIQAAL